MKGLVIGIAAVLVYIAMVPEDADTDYGMMWEI